LDDDSAENGLVTTGRW